jgi:hypothetical protein
MERLRPRLSLWSRARLALVLALTVVVSITYFGPSWSGVVRFMALLVFRAIDVLDVFEIQGLFHRSELLSVLLFVVVAVPIYTALTYVPNGAAWLGIRLWHLTRPYASTPAFLTYFFMAGTLGAIIGLFAWTVSPHVGSTLFKCAYAMFGFITMGWSVGLLRCWASYSPR